MFAFNNDNYNIFARKFENWMGNQFDKNTRCCAEVFVFVIHSIQGTHTHTHEKHGNNIHKQNGKFPTYHFEIFNPSTCQWLQMIHTKHKSFDHGMQCTASNTES